MATSVCLVWTASARAQSADAETLFKDGDRLMKQSKVAEACEAFEASNRIESRAGTLIRLGDCREQNHQVASAWSAFKDALTRVKDATKKAIAVAKIAELEAKLSYLTVSVSAANQLDGLQLVRNDQPLDRALWNRPVAANGGAYVIIARAPGYKQWSTTTSVPDEAGKVAVDVPKLDAEPAAPSPPPVVTVVTKQPDVSPAQSHVPSRWTARRELAIATATVTVLAIAGGVALGVDANTKQGDADRLCPEQGTPCHDAAAAQALNDTARRRALYANVGFGVSGAAAIATGVLWWMGAPEQARGVAIVPAPHAATLTYTGRF